MAVICLGPCCIPVSALFPVILLLLAPIFKLLRKTPLAKYLPDPTGATKIKSNGDNARGTNKTRTCCSSAGCADGVDDGAVKAIESIEQWEELKQGPLVIVDFTATWCKPCQKMAPAFEDVAAEHKESALFLKVDIDDLPEAFDGVAIPAFHVLKGGQKVDGVGGQGEERLRALVAKHCKKNL